MSPRQQIQLPLHAVAAEAGLVEFQRAICSLDGDRRIVAFMAQPFSSDPARPVVVLVHGALRSSGVFKGWPEQLQDIADVLIFDLPGHGVSSPVYPPNLETISSILTQALAAMLPGRRALLVGESVAGIMALRMGGLDQLGPIRAILALDPPMTTAKQWLVQLNFLKYFNEPKANAFFRSFGEETLGIGVERVKEIVYYPLLGGLKVPALIVRGDRPLFPVRSHAQGPSVFDDVDEFVVRNLYPGKAQLRQFENCGHVMVTEAQGRCVDLIRDMVAEHLAAPLPEPPSSQ